jgi:hypothetical protein
MMSIWAIVSYKVTKQEDLPSDDVYMGYSEL